VSTTDGALAEATGIAQALVGDAVKVSRLVTGGRNSRIWRVASGDRAFALKQYPSRRDDPRDRLSTEVGALRLMERHGIDSVPRVLGVDGAHGFALLSWIDGSVVNEVSDADIDAAIVFLTAIHGLRAAALPLMQAVSITDDATGRTVVDAEPPRPGSGAGAGPGGSTPSLTEIEGHVRMTLHGPRGDVNGALLQDGTILRLPPPEADRFAALLQPDRNVVAEGTLLANPLGKVLEVHQIGASRDQLNEVQAPPGPGGKKGRRGRPPA